MPGRHRSPALAVALAALVVALGGSAWAVSSFVGSGGQITGCVDSKGQFVLVKPGKACPKGRKKLTWNQRGQRGFRGFRGPAGANGPAAATRARSVAPVTTNGTSSTPVALSGDSWTQHTGEDYALIGDVTVDKPSISSCNAAGTVAGFLSGRLLVNGERVADIGGLAPASSAESTAVSDAKVPIPTTFMLPPAPAGATNVVAVDFQESACGGGGHFVVKSVRIDVLGVR